MPRADLVLMGVAVSFEADDAGLLRAAVAGYPPPSDAPIRDDAPPLRLRLALAPPSPESLDGAEAVAARVDGRRLALSGGGVTGHADADRREARCAVPRALAADPARLVAEVLDTLLLFLVTRSGRIPVHASGIVAGGTAAVLAGASGSGKSTLALAAQRAGLRVLSDDTVYVRPGPPPLLWGLPRPIHVYPADAGAGEGAMRLRSGRWKRAVPVSPDPTPAGRAALFLLERGERVSLEPVDPATAVERMVAMLEPGFDHFRDALPAAVHALAAAGAWRLTLSADPAAAVAAIHRAIT
jgi:hypothetical protein